MIKILKGSLALTIGLLVVLAIAALWLSNATQMPTDLPTSTAPPRGDTLLTEFYAAPDALPDNPGVLIRHETLEGASELASAGENIRLLYTSTDGLDGTTRNTVSGALYLPEGEAPEGGWPVLVWSHGTVGIGDVCAPSYAGRGARDPLYLNPWLDKGYAIAASDYQGLGTPGTHPYMDARSMAFSNLDLVRALKASDFPLSAKVILSGQSQGATGALSTASFRPNYAPEVELAGVIATGIPHFSPPIIWELAANSDRDAVSSSVPLSLYMLTFAEMLDPDFTLSSVISEKAKPIVDQINDTCVFDFVEVAQKAGLSNANTFSSRMEIPAMKVFSRAGLYEYNFDTPVFTGSGTADKITPFFMQQAFLEEACEAGITLVAKTYDGANHNQGLLQSGDDARNFAQRILTGETVESTCSA